MYEQYYGFREKPFSMAPDPDFLYFGRHHRRALTQLEFGLANEAAFLLITGEVGSGKTTLIRYLLDRLDSRYVSGFVGNTTRESGRLLQWVSAAFGLPFADKDDEALVHAFAAHLGQEHAAGRRALLIVDEAQNLGAARLEDLRVLSNLNHGKRRLLQTVLVGQPELAKHLRAPRLRQFAQRIGADYHIGRLSEAESHGYVVHRLQVAGGAQPDLFTPEAVELAHESSRGIPRLLNQLCDTALVYGYAEERAQIDACLMRDVIADRCAGGVYPGKPVSEGPAEAAPRLSAVCAKPGAA
jgi:type II secretory pathway predicted ATPase ExeA